MASRTTCLSTPCGMPSKSMRDDATVPTVRNPSSETALGMLVMVPAPATP